MYEEYSSEMKGSQSDLKNSGKTRYGGACTAAAFLKVGFRFVVGLSVAYL